MLMEMNYRAADQVGGGIKRGIVNPQAAGNGTLARLRLVYAPLARLSAFGRPDPFYKLFWNQRPPLPILLMSKVDYR